MAYVRLISAPVNQGAETSTSLVQEQVVETGGTLDLQVESVAIPEAEALEFVRSIPSASATHLMASGTDWSWEQLRDYVITQTEAKWGPRPRNVLKESGIFKGFIKRWGANSERIARAAFEVYGGMWNGAPVSIERFASGSDAYFASVIAKSL